MDTNLFKIFSYLSLIEHSLKIYGGFPSNANDATHKTICTRPITNTNYGLTILDGNMTSGGQSYHVVVAMENSHLDGFLITGGNAQGGGYDIINGTWVPQNSGGGIAVIGGCPRLENCSIYNNSATFRRWNFHRAYEFVC
jgi:hypothetical protein